MVPPLQSERCAAGPDSGMQQTMVSLLGGLPGDQGQITIVFNLSSLPMKLGGLGLRSARRLAPAAHWVSWADAMPMLQERVPNATEVLARELARMPVEGCLGELHTAWGSWIVKASSTDMEELLAGARPTPPLVADPGEWQHGWQFYTSSASDHYFRETVALAQSHASDFLLTEAMCECGGQNNLLGRHKAACPRSSTMKRRSLWLGFAEKLERRSGETSSCVI